MLLNPVATLDCLFLGSRLQRQVGSFSSADLHMFDYIACLLSLYRRRPLAEWGYLFVSTEYGAPFSRDIEECTQQLLRRGILVESRDQLQVTLGAERTLQSLLHFDLHRERLECLNASAATAAAFSLGIVHAAIGNEPELLRTKDLSASRTLLDSPARELIYEQFQALHQAVGGESRDLRIPAVAWLTALFQLTGNRGSAAG
jgi:hypothetical protein